MFRRLENFEEYIITRYTSSETKFIWKYVYMRSKTFKQCGTRCKSLACFSPRQRPGRRGEWMGWGLSARREGGICRPWFAAETATVRKRTRWQNFLIGSHKFRPEITASDVAVHFLRVNSRNYFIAIDPTVLFPVRQTQRHDRAWAVRATFYRPLRTPKERAAKNARHSVGQGENCLPKKKKKCIVYIITYASLRSTSNIIFSDYIYAWLAQPVERETVNLVGLIPSWAPLVVVTLRS